MTSKLKSETKSFIPKYTNSAIALGTTQRTIERQMVSYMTIFKNIADQISDLNNKFTDVTEAAE